MSLAQIVEVMCDADGCEETFAAAGVGRIEVRRQAAAEGWTRPRRPGSTPRPDYCPAHSARATVTLACTECGEPIEVPASARFATHGARCIVARESRERVAARARAADTPDRDA